jgi:hypothetical protein
VKERKGGRGGGRRSRRRGGGRRRNERGEGEAQGDLGVRSASGGRREGVGLRLGKWGWGLNTPYIVFMGR